jgi:hypothetical protein
MKIWSFMPINQYRVRRYDLSLKKVIFYRSMHLRHTHVSIRFIGNKLGCTRHVQNHMVKAQVRVYHGAKKHSI